MLQVIITGKGPGWSDCPKPTPETPVWGVTSIMRKNPYVSKVFEIHDLAEKFGRKHEGWTHQEAAIIAGNAGIPYVVREHWDLLPSNLPQEIYPLEEVIAEFGTDFIGCTMDACIALAIYQGYESIHIYGGGQHRDSEYDYQIDSLNFWLGVCTGRKIEFYLHQWGGVKHTDVLTTINGTVYGFDIEQRKFQYFNTMTPCSCTVTPINKKCITDIKII
jgi:hypothetical protein